MATSEIPPDLTVAWPGAMELLGVTLVEGGATWLCGRRMRRGRSRLLDDDGSERRVRLGEQTFHVFHGFIPGMQHGQRYGFRVHGRWDPGAGLRSTRRSSWWTPTPRAIDGHLIIINPGHLRQRTRRRPDDERRGLGPVRAAPRWPSTRPSTGRATNIPASLWGHTVIHETHVKGFTKLHPDIPEHRGTYAACPSGSGSPTSKRLGVSAVELLPIHGSPVRPICWEVGLSNYWGQLLAYLAPGCMVPTRPAVAGASRSTSSTDGERAASQRPGGDPRRGLQPHLRGQPDGPDAVWRESTAAATTAWARGTPATTDYTGCAATR